LQIPDLTIPQRACHGSDQGQAEGDVENWESEDEHSGQKNRDHRYQLGVMEDVVEDQKQDSCGNDCEAAIESVGETEVMPEDEARDAEGKKQNSDCE
jgi:hypothetical protein